AEPPPNPAAEAARNRMPLGLALLPYGLLVLVIGLEEFVTPVGDALNALTLRVNFPAVQTAAGYVTPAETGRTISLLGHPGALLALTALFIGWLYARRGCYKPGARQRVWAGVKKGALLPSV